MGVWLGSHRAGKTTSDSGISTGRFVELVPNRTSRETVEFETSHPAPTDGMTMTWTFEPRNHDATEVSVMGGNIPAATGREDHIITQSRVRFVRRTHRET